MGTNPRILSILTDEKGAAVFEGFFPAFVQVFVFENHYFWKVVFILFNLRKIRQTFMFRNRCIKILGIVQSLKQKASTSAALIEYAYY